MSRIAPAQPEALSRLLDQIRQRHMHLTAGAQAAASAITPNQPEVSRRPADGKAHSGPERSADRSLRSGAVCAALQARLAAWGLLPVYAAQVAQEAAQQLDRRTASATTELDAVRAVLARHWRPAPPAGSGWHVWVGAPGVGKTTCLSNWLVQWVLRNQPNLRLWRLDSTQANTAEALTVLAEALGVPVSRAWPQQPQPQTNETHLVDLPGLDWQNPEALAELQRGLHRLPEARVHLVLNAAYETRLWMAQIEAFARGPVSDLVFTHLDEEPRWGKLWNAVLGTKFAVSFLSAGQNVPGDLRPATVEELLPRQWPAVHEPRLPFNC